MHIFAMKLKNTLNVTLHSVYCIMLENNLALWLELVLPYFR